MILIKDRHQDMLDVEYTNLRSGKYDTYKGSTQYESDI